MMANLEIISDEFGFDRVEFNVFGLPMENISPSEFEDIHNAFSRKKLFSVRRQNDYYREYCFRKGQPWSGRATLGYNAESRVAMMSSMVSVNPSKAARLKLNGDTRTKSLDGNLNFPTSEFLEDGAYLPWTTRCREELSSLITNLIDTLDDITSSVTGRKVLNRSDIHVSLEQVELYRDYKVNDATTNLAEVAPLFRMYFKDPYKFGYAKNSFSLGAPIKAGEFFKLYAKTPNSVRFELSIEKKRIQRVLGSNELADGWGPRELATIGNSLLHETVPILAGFIETIRWHHTPWPVDRLLHQISRRTRYDETRKELLRQLATRGAVKRTDENASLLYRLKEDGLFHLATRGTYYIDAFSREALAKYLEFLRSDIS